MQAAQYHPCSVRFFFSTVLNDHDGQQTFQTTEYFPLLRGGHTGTVSCEHGRSHGPEVWPQMQSFPVPPTLCIGGGFKVITLYHKICADASTIKANHRMLLHSCTCTKLIALVADNRLLQLLLPEFDL